MTKSFKTLVVVGLASLVLFTGCQRKQRPSKGGANQTQGAGDAGVKTNNAAPAANDGTTTPNANKPANPVNPAVTVGEVKLTGVVITDDKKLTDAASAYTSEGFILEESFDAPNQKAVVAYDRESLEREFALLRQDGKDEPAIRKNFQVKIEKVKVVADAILIHYAKPEVTKDKNEVETKAIAALVQRAQAHSDAAKDAIENILPNLK